MPARTASPATATSSPKRTSSVCSTERSLGGASALKEALRNAESRGDEGPPLHSPGRARPRPCWHRRPPPPRPTPSSSAAPWMGSGQAKSDRQAHPDHAAGARDQVHGQVPLQGEGLEAHPQAQGRPPAASLHGRGPHSLEGTERAGAAERAPATAAGRDGALCQPAGNGGHRRPDARRRRGRTAPPPDRPGQAGGAGQLQDLRVAAEEGARDQAQGPRAGAVRRPRRAPCTATWPATS